MENLRKIPYILVLLGVFLPRIQGSTTQVPSGRIFPGVGAFIFRDRAGDPSKNITVWYYRPSGYNENSPILFILHGCFRNGDYYRDAWIEHAENNNCLIVAPEYDDRQFPGENGYNFGYMKNFFGLNRGRDKWAFLVIEHLFDEVRRITGNHSERYSIYGHSAGAQFVHRLVMCLPEARIDQAVAASAGTYLMPVSNVAFPYGMKNSGLSNLHLKQAFAKKLLIIVGEKDNKTDADYLPSDSGSRAQGAQRVERAFNFYRTARAGAARLNIPFAWEIQTVPNADHGNARLCAAATNLLFPRITPESKDKALATAETKKDKLEPAVH